MAMHMIKMDGQNQMTDHFGKYAIFYSNDGSLSDSTSSFVGPFASEVLIFKITCANFGQNWTKVSIFRRQPDSIG